MSIEFLAGDETPPEHGEPHPRRPRRPWWLLGLVALAVAGLVVVVTRQSGGPAGPSHGALPSLARPSDRPLGTASQSEDQHCGAAPFCQATLEVPDGLDAALREHVAGTIVGLHVQSYLAQGLATGGFYLSERDIDITTSTTAEILIRVRRIVTASRPAAVIITAGPGLGSVLLRGRGSTAFDVDLQYVAPETVAPSVDTLQALADDPVLSSL